jgi:pantothenate kinase type III
MIFLANIGNTNLTYGLYHTSMIATERFPIMNLSEQHCIEKLCLSLMEKFHLSIDQIEGVVLSSVVPEKTPLFVDVFKHVFSIEPTLISDRTVWGFDRSE